MKKFLWLILILALPGLARPATDPKTVEFLKKLNLYYYCLQREGLKNFSCDTKFVVTKAFKNNPDIKKYGKGWLRILEDTRYKVTLSNDGAVNVEASAPPPTGNAEADAALVNSLEPFKKEVKDMVETWQESTFKTLHDERDYAGDCKVKNGPNGFTVEIKRPEGEETEIYDRKAKLILAAGTLNGTPVKSENNFVPGPKGFVFIGGKMEFGKAKVNMKVKNQDVSGFLMPQQIQFDVMLPGLPGSLNLVWNFSNYVLNQ